jgi:translation initiation factor 2 beta subunit (eIF-2beta)/eIF-5
MAKTKFEDLIKILRERIEADYDEFNNEFGRKQIFERIDEFINKDQRSELERAFYLLLNQYPGDHKNYIVRPGERVLIPDIYDMSGPGIQYEIDFALYGGTIRNPVKVAIECDGMRSHGQKHSNRDRRKEVNLQAAGWVVMRFRSREIHQELEKFEGDENYTSDFLLSIENTIDQKLQLINHNSYVNSEFRSNLTGYKWDYVRCTHCGESQMDRLNFRTILCRHCKKDYTREIGLHEEIEYERNGILYFKK